MKKSTRILLIGGIVGATTLVAKLMEQKNKCIDELIKMNNQKVDIIRDLNKLLDFSEEAIEKSKGIITKQTQLIEQHRRYENALKDRISILEEDAKTRINLDSTLESMEKLL